LVRPGLIDGPRPEPRPMEKWAGKVLSVLGPLLPLSMKANPPEAIARAMLAAAISPAPGVTIVPSQDLH
ncbi:MAG: NAD-dependent dehydratase, partial [Alphaproteobacteria bacterium]|nr:NAD-dependent dehydratase [Alphaproteobacteria bacterium]